VNLHNLALSFSVNCARPILARFDTSEYDDVLALSLAPWLFLSLNPYVFVALSSSFALSLPNLHWLCHWAIM